MSSVGQAEDGDGVAGQTGNALTSKAFDRFLTVGSVNESLAVWEGGGPVSLLIDSDTHLFEPSGMWREYVDPVDRDVALHMGTDDLGSCRLFGIVPPSRADVFRKRASRAPLHVRDGRGHSVASE